MKIQKYVGLDVHKDKTTVAIAGVRPESNLFLSNEGKRRFFGLRFVS